MDRALGAEPADGNSDAAYRGFLFADLRGYTEFVQRYGDAAAADLLDAYRALVREEVARFTGAEVRTEGDSFYVVFPSARRAVACALAILAAAERDAETNPERPIRVGIGVNAGETVQRDEGFVGTAVNLAARVCSQASAGEVLVTAPVRDAVAAGAGVHVEPRGKRRLKGISEPIALYRVVASGEDARRRRPAGRLSLPTGLRAVGFGVALVAMVALAVSARVLLSGGSVGQEPDPGGASSSGSPSVSTSSAASAAAEDTSFPSKAEQALLDRIDDDVARHCERAEPDEVPQMTYPLPGGDPYSGPLAIEAGLRCTLGSGAEPDTVWYWHFTPVWAASEFFFQTAGRRSVPPGDCATDDRAYGRWEFGEDGGRVLCVAGSRDAQLMWTYASDERVMGIGVRGDGDIRAMYRWWREHARTLGES
jgi:class 3 adenylate cyclase